MDRTTFEYYRRQPQLRKSRIADVLPSYFSEYYPNLVEYLVEYYEALDQEGELTETFEYDLFSLRDLDEVNLKYIDRIFYEIANGASSKYFADPRLIGKLIPLLIQNKGNVFSAELFFRIFFGETPEIQFPKNNILFVFSGNNNKITESIIGTEGLRYLQNGRKYQILSILVRSGINFDRWVDLYKKFVHPAGFYLSAEIATETLATFGINFMPLSVGSADAIITLQDTATSSLVSSSAGEITLLSDSDNITFITSTAEVVNKYATFTVEKLDALYNDIGEMVSIASPTFDQDSDGIIDIQDMSVTLETLDEGVALSSFNKDSA
jgi:hypothetical protein